MRLFRPVNSVRAHSTMPPEWPALPGSQRVAACPDSGNNTVVLNGVTISGYQAGPGWDPVTGWGTPDAQILIPLLAR
jgi:hypothetical protein